jgi:nitroreductase
LEVLQAIKTRRSIRYYKRTPVARKKLKAVLEAARWAPSWANTQCWRFIVVSDSALKEKLADMMGVNRAAAGVRQAPLLVIACAEMEKSGYIRGRPSTGEGDWYMYDVALAMGNLVLAAHSLGLGTVHIGYFDAEKAAAILGVPPGFRVVALTPLGHPAREARITPRKELAEIAFRNRYGQSGEW